MKTYGRIDVLVNNAGVMPASFLVKNQTQEWDQLIDINIKGVLYNIGAVLPILRKLQPMPLTSLKMCLSPMLLCSQIIKI